MGLLRWLVEKIVVYGFVLAVFYVIGQSLGVVPQPLKDFVSWLAENFAIIALTICILAICYTAVRLSSRGEARGAEA